MLLLIDNTIKDQGTSPREIRRALAQLHPDMRVVVEPFKNIYPEFVQTLKPSHIILSGQSHPWDDYSPESLAGVLEVIRRASQPVLGVCGGQQQMALAFGAPVGLIQRIAPGEGYEGAFRERGFCAVCGSTLFFRSPGWPGELHAVLADRKSTRLNSSHVSLSRMPSSA